MEIHPMDKRPKKTRDSHRYDVNKRRPGETPEALPERFSRVDNVYTYEDCYDKVTSGFYAQALKEEKERMDKIKADLSDIQAGDCLLDVSNMAMVTIEDVSNDSDRFDGGSLKVGPHWYSKFLYRKPSVEFLEAVKKEQARLGIA